MSVRGAGIAVSVVKVTPAWADASLRVAAPRRVPLPRVDRRRWLPRLVALVAVMLLGGAVGLQVTTTQHSDRMANFSRGLIGDENTARLESWYFALQDRADRLKYHVFSSPEALAHDRTVVSFLADDAPAGAADAAPAGLDEATFAVAAVEEVPIVVEPARPAPLTLPDIRLQRPGPGEGVWTTAGLPRTSPDDVLMAKTFVRPDAARPYALVGVLLLDKRRIRLHLTGGTEDPGGDRGIKGPGVIPMPERPALLAAWNGGFKGPHGGFGMFADGKTYRPLRNGLASVVVLRDGSVRLGEWGRDLAWSDDIVAVRQNAVLLVDNCEVSRRTGEANDTWGYVQVNSAEFITWRSAIGLTRDGDLLYAAGNSLSAATLARALWSAGACYAMQLDINTPYVLASVFLPGADGAVRPAKFMDSMTDNPGRFLTTQARDFMYVSLDETNFAP